MKNELLGMLVTAGSILAAAIVSGLRLKPYIDAGETYTPASFMLYPALLAILLAAPLVFLLRRVQDKKDVDLGPLTFKDRTPLMAIWCVLYIVIAVTFFPYDGPQGSNLDPEPARHKEMEPPLNQPIHLSYATNAQTEMTAR